MDTADPEVAASINSLRIPGMLIDHRIITRADEHGLLPEEAVAVERSVVKVRCASGAARIVARKLFAQLGHPQVAIPKSASGAPIWPESIVGSLAHDSRIAVAAIGMRSQLAAVGIDIEPAELLPCDLLDLIATPKEQLDIDIDQYRGRILFAVKEAVYKAVYPLDHEFLEHHDVEIDFATGKAMTKNRLVEFRFCASTHIVAVAFILASRGHR